AHTTTAREISSIFAVAGIPWPVSAIVCNSVTTIKALILRTGRIAIMSRQLVQSERDAGQLAYVPLRNAKPTRTVGVRRHRHAQASPLARRFSVILRDVARDIARLR